jgi:transcriptional regulator with XRE-family HTH domain
MGENRHHFPFKSLGTCLRKRRESIHESLAEVSGAVEIDEEMLSKIEQGLLLPSEDILLLLISHLSISEEEAASLWEMAGYEQQKSSGDPTDKDDASKQMFMVIPFDNRILYTDDLQISSNKHGLVLNFMQSGNAQQTTIARIGMSRDYAQTMLEILKNSLSQSEPQPRMLPKPKTTTDEPSKH